MEAVFLEEGVFHQEEEPSLQEEEAFLRPLVVAFRTLVEEEVVVGDQILVEVAFQEAEVEEASHP